MQQNQLPNESTMCLKKKKKEDKKQLICQKYKNKHILPLLYDKYQLFGYVNPLWVW